MRLLILLERLKCKSQQKARTANKVLPKAGVTNIYETFVLYSTLVFQINPDSYRDAESPAFGNTQTVIGYGRETEP